MPDRSKSDSDRSREAENPVRGDLSRITHLQMQLFTKGVVSRRILDAVPTPVLIINESWQVVYANGAVLSLFAGDNGGAMPGLSEGEAFHCLHTRQNTRDAGKYEYCRICGVARALSRSFGGEEVSEDCRLCCELAGSKGSLDLRVWATPLEFGGEHFSILSLVDISDKSRREILENTCFHDLLNSLTSVKALLSVLKEEEIEDQADICHVLEQAIQGSIDEITALRVLEKAEKKQLPIHPEAVECRDFLEVMLKTLQCHPAAEGKNLQIAEGASAPRIETDPRLLRRIVSNMLINALEATGQGETVTLGCHLRGRKVEFWVHNPSTVPKEVRGQIFQRSVSTRGPGRGIGTYSIKLLSEILGGEARFTTNASEGTRFSVLLPQTAPQTEPGR